MRTMWPSAESSTLISPPFAKSSGQQGNMDQVVKHVILDNSFKALKILDVQG